MVHLCFLCLVLCVLSVPLVSRVGGAGFSGASASHELQSLKFLGVNSNVLQRAFLRQRSGLGWIVFVFVVLCCVVPCR